MTRARSLGFTGPELDRNEYEHAVSDFGGFLPGAVALRKEMRGDVVE